jgi:hypothetical protein
VINFKEMGMTVDILGREYKVKVTKMPKHTFGDCDVDKAVIRLNSRHGDLAVTLVHEVIHAALFESGIKHLLDHHEGLEEAIVRAIEHGLTTAALIPEVDFERLDPHHGVEQDSQG